VTPTQLAAVSSSFLSPDATARGQARREGGTAITGVPAAVQAPGDPRVSQAWHWLEAENRRLDALDLGNFEVGPGLRELLTPMAVIIAVTTALTAWLISGC
jgi:hypothetical protein